MKSLSLLLRVSLLAAVLLSAGCNAFLATPAPPGIPGLAKTLAAQTLAVQFTQQARRATATPRPPLAPPLVSDQGAPGAAQFDPAPWLISLESATPIPSLTPWATPTESACTNLAEFIRDVTVPDYTPMKAGQRFVKTWQLGNVGTCTWTPDYQVVFLWGDPMGAPQRFPLGQTVAPGEVVNISVELIAPREANTYQGNWMLMDPLGNRFGTGYRGRQFFWVLIVVGNSFSQALGGGGIGCIGGG